MKSRSKTKSKTKVRTVSKGILKAKMLQYFRQVEKTGEELIVTDRHIPVLKIVPFQKSVPAEEVFAELRGRLKYREDLTAPTEDEWEET